MPDVKSHQHSGDEAQNEASGAPFQSNPDRMDEQDEDDGNADQGQDEGMRAETFHELSSVERSPKGLSAFRYAIG
jgi:hypothetical protein